jgi:hypothetical protein
MRPKASSAVVPLSERIALKGKLEYGKNDSSLAADLQGRSTQVTIETL